MPGNFWCAFATGLFAYFVRGLMSVSTGLVKKRRCVTREPLCITLEYYYLSPTSIKISCDFLIQEIMMVSTVGVLSCRFTRRYLLSTSSFHGHSTIHNVRECNNKFIPSRYKFTSRSSSSLTSPANDPSRLTPLSSTESSSNLVPIDFQACSQISGEESQILLVNLKPNQIPMWS
jgi:hypothetical protein